VDCKTLDVCRMKGLDMAERWRDCLNKDPACLTQNPNIPPPPGGAASPPPTQPSPRAESSPQGGRASTGYAPDNDTEQTEPEETDASYVSPPSFHS